jgi:hypothetical protein
MFLEGGAKTNHKRKVNTGRVRFRRGRPPPRPSAQGQAVPAAQLSRAIAYSRHAADVTHSNDIHLAPTHPPTAPTRARLFQIGLIPLLSSSAAGKRGGDEESPVRTGAGAPPKRARH